MTNDYRCATCRWWAEDDDEPLWAGSHRCRLTVMREGQMERETLALATGSDDYANVLLTRPEFGCVQWQDRSTPWWETA